MSDDRDPSESESVDGETETLSLGDNTDTLPIKIPIVRVYKDVPRGMQSYCAKVSAVHEGSEDLIGTGPTRDAALDQIYDDSIAWIKHLALKDALDPDLVTTFIILDEDEACAGSDGYVDICMSLHKDPEDDRVIQVDVQLLLLEAKTN